MRLLENRDSRGAFGTNRLDTVRLIAGQLSVSLDNALLYTSLEQQVADRTHDLREANHQPQQHRDHLEELVEQSTQELSRAKEQAETASIAKSAFLANTSHEIRTPLNAISGMAYMIRRAGLTPRQAEQMGKLEAASNHLLKFISDILELSVIEAGRFALEETEVRPARLVDEVITMVLADADAKGLRLVSELDSIPDTLLGDPTRLQQALLNYAANAVKFTEAGSITLRIRLERDETRAVLLRFEVEDTGIGISEEAQLRLFNAFEQADNSMTRQYGGNGLGLAITRKIAELMGGETGVRSTLGVGSTFWFTARLKRSRPQAVIAPTNGEDAEEIPRREYADSKILLVEDEPLNREIARALLEDVGLAVSAAEDGREAVSLAAEQSYALILMDMQMSHLDGLEATREIRRLTGYKDTPILAMTANAFAEDKQRRLAAGMNDFVSKPVHPSHFFIKLLTWLNTISGQVPNPD